MKSYVPGLREDGDDSFEVFDFSQPRRLYVAKWWMRPICWLLRRPTEFWR